MMEEKMGFHNENKTVCTRTTDVGCDFSSKE